MSTPTPVRVLRGTDLLDLTFGFLRLAFHSGPGPRRLIRADPRQDGLLVVTFGPQHVLEQAVDETAPGEPRDLPLRSLISGRSVLVFEVGEDDEIPYSEAGLLEAMQRLPLRVLDAAREPAAPTATVRLAEPAPTGGDATARATALVRLLRTTAELSAGYGLEATLAAAAAAGAEITHTSGGEAAPRAAAGPQDPLADPDHPFTGVELPYRLLLSPSQKARWTHRAAIDDPRPGERVELWHTRTDAPTARAVWNRERAPGPPLPPPEFRVSMSSQDRAHIVDLTTGPGPGTRPVDLDNLMLSAVGGWLDSLGAWPVRPPGIPLSEWRHRATMGRDHYVRLIYEGFLCPFGHRAALVKVTERKFDDPRAAYLHQRFFVLVRQPLRTYDVKTPLPGGPGGSGDLTNVLFPFTSVRIDTLVTPNLIGSPTGAVEFFPATRAEDPFRFKVTAVDHDGRIVEFRTPLQFVPETRSTGSALAQVVAGYNRLSPLPTATDAPADPPERTRADLQGQSVALAPATKPDDTRLDVATLVWGVAAPPGLAQPGPAGPGEAHFIPQLSWATATVPAAGALSGNAGTVPVSYAKRYAESGFSKVAGAGRAANAGEVFLNVLQPLTMDFTSRSDRSGGLVAPSMVVAGLSRLTGPIAGGPGADALQTFADGGFRPADFFKALGAKLLGVIPLEEMIKKIDGLNEPLKVPNFFTETISAVTGFLSDLRRVRELLQREPGRYPPAAQRVLDSARTLVDTIAAFLAQELARRPQDPPGPRTIEEIDRAFDAFATALTTLLDTLPPDADPGVRTLLVRAQEQVATWTSAAGRALSLRDAVLAAARGAKLPETVNARLEWNPEIQPWPPASATPIFRPDPARGRFSLAVDLRGSLRPDLTAGADITCTLEEFTLVLAPPVMEAMELTFQRVRFTARAGKKLDVEIVFRGIKFIGPLAFVDTLRKLIPIDGFSDPPGLRVTPSGIVATYALPLPNLAIGVFSLENLRLAASLDLPFVGKPLEASFSFCTRQAPFRLTVSMLGGGGFFGIVITPERVAVLEAALEFGAALSMNLGVASGSLSVMAGIYFRLELATGTARLTGYFRARGEVDVLGIVSASIEIYLALEFETAGGTVYGRARITISIHIGFWSQSVTIECEKRFIGSGPPAPALPGRAATEAADTPRPPTFAEMMAPYPDPVSGTRRVPVDEYCTAFAEVS
ncbi:hypothetical protein ABZ951_01720 [Streptomyces sp. NPDC046215]|uniref:Uncharacterized protein n=1 Tax=Streptomyces stramineus TaxID=173861 RepID=A0ABN1ACK8_9ACTN